MRPCRSLVLVVLAAACSKPAQPAALTDAPGTTDAAPPEPEAPADAIEPICAALMPTLGKWQSELKRKQEIAALIDQGHVDPCDHRAPIDAQPAPGSDEASYCRAAIGHEICKRPAQARRSIELRTTTFPESADAWLALAAWQIAPLKPNDTGLPYNEDLPPAERLRIAGEVLVTLRQAERLRPDDPRVYDLIAVANEQRQFARLIVGHPSTPEEKLEVVRAQEDDRQSTAALAKLCKLQQLPSCRSGAARETSTPTHDRGENEQEEIPLEEID